MTNTLQSNCAPFIDVASTTMKGKSLIQQKVTDPIVFITSVILKIHSYLKSLMFLIAVLEKIIPRHMFQFFQSMDVNNDQNLDINEFFNFAQELANANDFYEKALLDDSGDGEVITQNEWECTKDQITKNECDTKQFSPDRTLVSHNQILFIQNIFSVLLRFLISFRLKT